MEAPDGELVRPIAARAADAPAAEAELCRRFAPRIRLYGLRHLRDEERARDLVQAVLLAVLQAARAGRIADPERVDRFMLGTSRNVAQRMRESDSAHRRRRRALAGRRARRRRTSASTSRRCRAAWPRWTSAAAGS